MLTPIMSVWSKVIFGTGWPSISISAMSSGSQHGPSIVGQATNFDTRVASSDVLTAEKVKLS